MSLFHVSHSSTWKFCDGISMLYVHEPCCPIILIYNAKSRNLHPQNITSLFFIIFFNELGGIVFAKIHHTSCVMEYISISRLHESCHHFFFDFQCKKFGLDLCRPIYSIHTGYL